jgi:hypothetical protein
VQVAASEENINEAASAGFDTLETSLQGSEAPYKAPLATVLMALHKYVLSRPLGKLLVLGCCITGGMLSCASIARISTGLDQAVALPEDSYLQAYYRCDIHCARLRMVPRVWCPWRTALEGCQGLLPRLADIHNYILNNLGCALQASRTAKPDMHAVPVLCTRHSSLVLRRAYPNRDSGVHAGPSPNLFTPGKSLECCPCGHSFARAPCNLCTQSAKICASTHGGNMLRCFAFVKM